MYKFSGVSFINSLPFFCGNIPSEFEMFYSNPSELNELVRLGQTDISMISRWIYPQCEKDYAVLPEFCIGGDGEIMSIKLFSKYEISQIYKGSIFITSQTGTSSRAFRKICFHKYGFDIMALPQKPLDIADSVILIGDNAMLFNSSRYQYCYDLGELWKEWAKCKMLYAVFVIRKSLFDEIAPRVSEFLNTSLSLFAENPQKVYNKAMELTSGKLDIEVIKRYYTRLIFKMQRADFDKSFNFVKENADI